MDWKELAKKLGLAETATEADVRAALDAKIEVANAAPKPDLPETVANALGIDAKANADAACQAIVALRAPQAAYAAVNAAAGLQPDATPEQLKAKVDELTGAVKGTRAEQIVANALNERKITADQKDWWLGQAKANADGTEAVLKGMKPLTDKPADKPADDGTTAVNELTAEELAVCNQMGIDPKTYLEQKKAEAA